MQEDPELISSHIYTKSIVTYGIILTGKKPKLVEQLLHLGPMSKNPHRSRYERKLRHNLAMNSPTQSHPQMGGNSQTRASP